MILAGDVGGTKANLALFESNGDSRTGPPLHAESHRCADFPTFDALLESYRGRHPGTLDVACFGVAGPVLHDRVKGTNLPWEVDAAAASRRLGGSPVLLLNDLAAAGYSVPALGPADLVTIQEGTADREANAGLISAGTGLGESILARMDGELIPIASEAGFADFAPRTDLEIDLFRALREQIGRVAYEHVLSGPGLVLVARWTHTRGAGAGAAAWKTHEAAAAGEELAASVSAAAIAGGCRWCAEALEIFVTVYGAEAGNLALRGVAWAGIYLGGGIAPKILPALRGERFLQAFRDKEPHRKLLSAVPVHVIQNEQAAVLGAARFASLSRRKPL